MIHYKRASIVEQNPVKLELTPFPLPTCDAQTIYQTPRIRPIKSAGPPPWQVAEDQNNFVTLLRQLASVAKRAGDIFEDLQSEVLQTSTRLDQMEQSVRGLDRLTRRLNAKKMKLGGLYFSRYSDVKSHYGVCAPPPWLTDGGLFVPKTRPPPVIRLYNDLAPRSSPKIGMEDFSVQTDPQISSSSSHTISSSQTMLSLDEDKLNNNNPKKNTTVVPHMISDSGAIYATVVPVDTSRKEIRRLSVQRRSFIQRDPAAPQRTSKRPGRLVRRRTIGGIMDIPVYDTVAGKENDYAYQATPPVSDSRKGVFSAVKEQFASLRRSTRSRKSVQPPCHTLPSRKVAGSEPSTPRGSVESDLGGRGSNSSSYHASRSESITASDLSVPGKTGGASLKGFLKRSLSLRLPRRRASQKQITEDLYSEIPFRRQPLAPINTNVAPPRPYHSPLSPSGRTKPIRMPISTTSQVFQVARELRQEDAIFGLSHLSAPQRVTESPYGALRSKNRPPSTMSLESAVSLDLDSTAKNGCYHRGFRLEYPSECQVTSTNPAPELSLDLDPYKPLLDLSEGSVGEESAYSCDQEGYFTSMHRDSGLWTHSLRRSTPSNRLGPKGADFRGRSFSTHSSSSTVAEISDGSEGTPVKSLIAFSTPSPRSPASPSPLDPAKINVRPSIAYPPLCDISESENENTSPLVPTNVRQFHSVRSPLSAPVSSPSFSFHYPVPQQALPVATVRPQLQNGCFIKVGTEAIPEAAFDAWLLKKFEQEKSEGMTLDGPQPFGVSSFPRRTARALHCGLEATANTESLPRKTVRFCDS